MRTRLSTVIVAPLVAATTLLAGTVVPVGAEPGPAPQAAPPAPRAGAAVDRAEEWLVAQQQPDGGFELAGFPGFETSDAVLALAAAGQSQGHGTWSEAEALAVVEARTVGGKNPLDAIDDLVDTPASPAQAAKVIALVAVPLGLDVSDFDPSDDSEEPVDLLALVTAAAGDGSYPGVVFGGQVTVAWALAAVGETVPAPLLAAIDAAQQANGSFHFGGTPEGSGIDPDLTAAVVIALTVAGRPASDPTVRRAVVALGRSQGRAGHWATEFDDGNPSSTAMVALAAATLGSDPDGPCWRERAEPRFAGVRYRPVSHALARAQVADGRIASPNDVFGVNTLATSQALQAFVATDGFWPYHGAACTALAPSAHRRLVNAYYYDLLGRFSDEPGAAFWVEQLGRGMGPDHVAQRLAGTREYDARVTGRIFEDLLHRRPTLGDEAVVGWISSGRRLGLAAVVLGSTEYLATTVEPPATPSDATWIDAVYQDVVGRAADPGGKAWAQGRLTAGHSREQVAWNLLHTPEALGQVIDGFYVDLLRRSSDAPGRAYWVGRLQAGHSPERLMILIAGSVEYVAATAPVA